jgi:hypothetical protein
MPALETISDAFWKTTNASSSRAMETVVDLLMASRGFDRGEFRMGNVDEPVSHNGIDLPVSVRVLVVGESAFHDEGDTLLELGHRGYGQFTECFDRYRDTSPLV